MIYLQWRLGIVEILFDYNIIKNYLYKEYLCNTHKEYCI